MGKFYYKKATTSGFDRQYIKDQNQNLDDIGKDIREVDTKINDHKKAKNAHTSEQISHKSGLNVGQEIEVAKARFRNLVLNVDGTNIKEVVDARVGRDGTIYPTLRDRLDADGKVVDDIRDDLITRISFKNALSYGADPTGKTPSADAIQSALDEIHSEGGGWLVIPGGTYLIDKRMIIYENTRVTMAVDCVLLRGWSGGFFANGKPTDNFSGYSGRGNIVIEGGMLDGNYLKIETYKTNAMDSVIIGHAKNIVIDNVTFKDVITDHAIDANGCNGLRITNCRFTGFIDTSGTRPFSEAIQLGEFTKGGVNIFGSFDSTPNTNVYIAHNYFGKSDLLGGWGCAVGNHYAVYDVFQTNITIFDNTIEDCGFAGIRTFKWGEVKIINNVFRRNRECVRISQVSGGIESSKNASGVQMNRPQNAQNILIQGNDFYEYTVCGIVTYGQIYNKEAAWSDGIRIFGNYFKLREKDIGSYGNEQAIQIIYGRNVFISDNRIFGGRRGIWLEGCFNTFISNNYISCVDTEAVYVAKSRDTSSTITKSTHLSIDGNEINTIGRNGIYVQNCDNFDVRNNNIFNTNIEQGSKDRGGVFVEKAYDGRIEGNRIRGVEKIFAILVQSTATEVNVFNTKGTGRVIVQGDSNLNGYYGTTQNDYIRKISTKSSS
ncbi:right-handed parallel beta-helix repeat-containing protein [Bacillus licheniformis]|nr:MULTISPECIES: right-handed parallel beta-helix repeat-containing protein [Bacillus]MCM3377727.1 right-handed parallel beta-helix repeat-containing protein [Bacillus licheniformis]MCM3432799.1 right-handed parallel beta-helix repeat-containing protein [Bacillus licheniformis]MCM3465573.1 right-handed parallel beta-helix repeat-containing protein [Bacillus licheniformis]MCM3750497.1 right-handed parallel beta-helix repeat-containing protein [Bacillus licheniformis]MCU9958707.1 Plasmin and fib